MAEERVEDRVARWISSTAMPLFLVHIVMPPSRDRAQNTLCHGGLLGLDQPILNYDLSEPDTCPSMPWCLRSYVYRNQ